MSVFKPLERTNRLLEAARTQGGSGSLPSHHYALAHVVLRETLHAFPDLLLSLGSSEGRERVLGNVWQLVCEICDRGGKTTFTMEDVQVIPTRVNDFPLVLIILPPPQTTSEAFMVAAVLEVPLEELSQRQENPRLRYFTLELGFGADLQGRPVLCEWDSLGSHINYGYGPSLSPQAFVEALQRFL